MLPSRLKLAALASYLLSSATVNGQSQNDNSGQYHVPQGSPGFQHNHSTAAVTFDQHSFFLGNERIMLYSGEFHPWRTPTGPVLWRDVLEKMKSAGFSGISIYLHWGVTAFKQGTLDFKYYRSVTDFLDIAKEVGLLVVVRPGPYINAETNGGGFPGWLANVPGTARTNASSYTEAWLPWITEVSKAVAPYQYPDGPVIAMQSENEFYGGTERSPYMQQIEDTYRANGLTKVPFMHNDANTAGNYASGLGQVDAYGFDNYPLGFDCSNPTVWGEVPTNYDTVHQTYFPAEPLWIPEFQGGSFDPWGGPGYEKCYDLINEEFANVYYKNAFSYGTTLMSMYMTFGGTNWGNLAEPTVYTSYDYGGPIKEDRSLTTKYGEMKLQAHFMSSSTPAYVTAVRIGNGTVGFGTPYSNNTQIFTTHLHDPASDTNFYFVRQTTNKNTSPVQFSLKTNSTAGTLTIPQYGGQITLAGRESKIIVTNYGFGTGKQLLYTTGEVFTWTTIDQTDYLVLYAIGGQSIEAVVKSSGNDGPTVSGSKSISAKSKDGNTIISGTTSGVAVVSVGSTKVIIVDKITAYAFSQPRLVKSGYFNIGPARTSALIYGPYLVRNATLSKDRKTLSIVGDTNKTTIIEVFAPESVKTFKWNGETIKMKQSAIGSMSGTIGFKFASLASKVPSLKSVEWKCKDTFPEVETAYDDSTWTTCNKTSTQRPWQPISGKYLLYAGEYGYHQGNLIFRGHFKGKNVTSLSLSVQGGFNFGYSAFINAKFLGSDEGSAQSPITFSGGTDLLNGTWALTSELLNDGDNVVTVIMDNTGLEEESGVNDGFKKPRGIRGYSLVGGDFDFWKVAGNYLGEDFPDKVRGPLNEGGLWVERVGAHLPGYPTTGWESSKASKSCGPLVGITKAGAMAYRTSFDLDLPKDADIPIALKFTPTTDSSKNITSKYRSMLYVNGWQFGKYADNLGPQRIYPLPEGILNHRGNNEILLTVWSLDPQGAKIAGLDLITTAVVQSSKGYIPTVVTSPTYAQLRK